MKNYITGSLLVGFLFAFSNTWAVGSEYSNDCRATDGDSCERYGSCSIQGTNWIQHVYVDKSDKFDTQGWPGLCDMVHVSLVQGNCEYLGPDEGIEANLSNTTYAIVHITEGTLTCGGDDGGNTGGGGGGSNFCDSHPNHRKCQVQV